MSTLSTIKTAFLFLFRKAWQLALVCVMGGILYLVVNEKLSPQTPDSTRFWVYIDAPHMLFLWKRGWWLGCTDAPQIRCALLSGIDHDRVYEGPYVPCDGLDGGHPDVVAPKNSSNMWVLTEPDHQLAPIVYLRDGSVLVPASLQSQCGQLKSRPR